MKHHPLNLEHIPDEERKTEEMALLIKHQPFQHEETSKSQPETPQPYMSAYSFFLFHGVPFQQNILAFQC